MADDVKKDESWKPGDGAKAVGQAIKDNPGHAVVGAILGQVLIPIPIVGAGIGAGVAAWIGKKNDPAQNK
jgi:phage tail tape-measure protein